MKKIIILIMVLTLGFTVNAMAGDLGLITSLTGAGAGNNYSGIRYCLTGDICVDGGVAYVDDGTGEAAAETAGWWADIYYGNWGLLVENTTNTEDGEAYSLMFAVEQAINNSIVLGIAFNVATSYADSDKAMENFNAFDAYLVLNI